MTALWLWEQQDLFFFFFKNRKGSERIWLTFVPLKMVTLISVHEATPGKEYTWYSKAETVWLSGLLF